MLVIIILVTMITIIIALPKNIFKQPVMQILLLLPIFFFNKYMIVAYLIAYFAKSYSLLPIPIKEDFSNLQVIPANIFQTWSTKDLPKGMSKCVMELKEQNPEFTHYLFDDNDCRNYIRKNYDEEVLYAFNKLKPGAYKADLWRLCVLYKEGGIYIDIKFKCANNFKLVRLLNNNHFTLDLPDWYLNGIGIYNAFMVSKPKNEYLRLCIDKIVENVKNNYYGRGSLYPTGPGLMGEIYLEMGNKAPNIDIFAARINGGKELNLIYENNVIIVPYENYREECETKKHYNQMYREKDIYNLI